MKPVLLAGLLIAVALGTMACFLLRRSRIWSEMKPAGVNLDGLAEIQVPPDLRYDPEATEKDGDAARFRFQRVNDYHLNGQTSYAENLLVVIAAPDVDHALLAARRDRGVFDPGKPGPAVEDAHEGPLHWQVFSMTYRRDPVEEPAHFVRLTDEGAGVVYIWWGYQKQYTVEQAKANLKFLRSTLKLAPERAAWFEKLRSYSTASRDNDAAYNLQLLATALRELGFPPAEAGRWTRYQDWRYTIDSERPQQFHLVLPIRHMRMPDSPFRLTAPLTTIRFVRNFWWQDNQGMGGGLLPKASLDGLATELQPPEDIHFFSIHALNLWKAAEGEGNPVLTQIRAFMADAERQKQDFLTKGAIDADAEP